MKRRHSFKERLKIVSRLQSGESVRAICREFNLDASEVRHWYLRYEKYGEKGLRRKKYRRRSLEEKLVVVGEIMEKGLSLQETCLRHDLCRTTVKTWCRKHRMGISLEPCRLGRPPKKHTMARPKKKEPQTELEKLQEENLRLRAENALLKKAKALFEEIEARKRLNGQKSSTN